MYTVLINSSSETEFELLQKAKNYAEARVKSLRTKVYGAPPKKIEVFIIDGDMKVVAHTVVPPPPPEVVWDGESSRG